MGMQEIIEALNKVANVLAGSPKVNARLNELAKQLSDPNLETLAAKKLLDTVQKEFEHINNKLKVRARKLEEDKSGEKIPTDFLKSLRSAMEKTENLIGQVLGVIGPKLDQEYSDEIYAKANAQLANAQLANAKEQLANEALLTRMNTDFEGYPEDKFSIEDVKKFKEDVFKAYADEVAQTQEVGDFVRTKRLLNTLEQYCEKTACGEINPHEEEINKLKSKSYLVYEKLLAKEPVMSDELVVLLTPAVEKFIVEKSSNAESKEVFCQYLSKQDTDTLLTIVEKSQEATPNLLLANLYDQYLQSLPEVCYQDYLIKKAIKNANDADAKSLRFDPQGSLLTSVMLDDDKEYNAILKDLFVKQGKLSVNEELSETILTELNDLADKHYGALPHGKGAKRDNKGKYSFKELLQAKMGGTHSLSATTVCNVDVSLDKNLTKEYTTWLTTPAVTPQPQKITFLDWVFGKKPKDTTQKLIDATAVLLNSENRLEAGSINAISEEIEMHMSLALHVLEKSFKEAKLTVPDATWESIRTAAFQDINLQVRDIFQRALVASFDSKKNAIDYDQLNSILDISRKKLSKPENCYDILIKHSPDFIEDFHTITDLASIQQAIVKKSFESTTATPNDYLTASNLGINARIEGTENTAHHKALGLGQQAARKTRYSDGSIIVRLPSIPDVDNTALTLDQHVADTALKINEEAIELRYALGGYQGPVMINRETAIPNNPGIWDKKNQQGLRAEIEMKAIHLLNAGLPDHSHFVHFQNISVNGHSENLGYDTTGTLKEATVMAEMAMLANFHYQVTMGRLDDSGNEIENAYTNVINCYQAFLQDRNTDLSNAVFSTSSRFEDVKKALIQAKTDFKTIKQPESTNAKVLANQALLSIFAHDLHLNEQHGRFIQSLATFAQDGTITGCKTAAERFGTVEGRALLLRLISPRTSSLVDAKQDITQVIQAFIKNPDATTFDDAEKKMNANYNKYTVQARPNAAMSGLEQGGAGKVETYLKGFWNCLINIDSGANLNTNRAESPEVTRLKTSKTGGMQAHKGDHAGDLLAALKKNKKTMVEREVADTSPIKRLLDFLQSEVDRLENKVFSSWRNDSRIPLLMALIKEIKNPYSTIEEAALLTRMETIFKEGTLSRKNYDAFIGKERPDLTTTHVVEATRTNSTDSTSSNNSADGISLRATMYERPSIAKADWVNDAPLEVGVDSVQSENEDGGRLSIATVVDLDRDTFSSPTVESMTKKDVNYSSLSENDQPPVGPVVTVEESMGGEKNLLEKTRNIGYSLLPAAVTAIAIVSAFIPKTFG